MISNNTTIFSAIKSNDTELVETILKENIDVVNSFDESTRFTPLITAIIEDKPNPELIDLLLKYKADPEKADGRCRMKPITWTIIVQAHEILKNLKDLGIPCEYQYLDIAISQLDLTALQILVNDKKDIQLVDGNGSNILHLLICKANETTENSEIEKIKKIYLWCLGEGADPNEKNDEGITPLHYACEVKNNEMIEFLKNNGSNQTIKDNYGYSAKDWEKQGCNPYKKKLQDKAIKEYKKQSKKAILTLKMIYIGAKIVLFGLKIKNAFSIKK